MAIWKDQLARLKPRISYEDARRICTSHAEHARKIEPLLTALNYLAKGDDSINWFMQWQLEVMSSIKQISEGKSRKKQAHLCRVAILESEESNALNQFILDSKNSLIRDFLLEVKYSNEPDLTGGEMWSTFIMHYTYSLLSGVGLRCLYDQQFNLSLPLDDFYKPYKAICGSYIHVLSYTGVIQELATGHDDPQIRSMAQSYLDKVSSEVLEKLRSGKQDFEAWIKSGHVHGMEEFRIRFVSFPKKVDMS